MPWESLPKIKMVDGKPELSYHETFRPTTEDVYWALATVSEKLNTLLLLGTPGGGYPIAPEEIDIALSLKLPHERKDHVGLAEGNSARTR